MFRENSGSYFRKFLVIISTKTKKAEDQQHCENILYLIAGMLIEC